MDWRRRADRLSDEIIALRRRIHDTAIHRADYQLNEEVIPLGMKVMSRAVLSLLG